jgi:hypothetical protein
MNPATFLRVLGPEPWNVAYVEPSIRPDDGRYGENPNRFQQHYQFQVILKPDPGNPQEIYLDSLKAIGIDPRQHDIRFVEDNWEQPAISAWGLGWEVWLDGQEITQVTYFQQVGGVSLDPVAVEDQDVLSKGTRIDGHIAEVKAAGRRGRGGDLSLVFDSVELPNGQKLAITGSLTEVFSSEGGSDPSVGPEGDLKGGGASRKKQAAIIAGATAVGATGGLGTGIAGAATGVALAILLPHGKQAALAAGSLIGMRLDRDVTFTLTPPTESK